jgi:hypothetical protein
VAGVWRKVAITLRQSLPRNPACVQALKFKESRMGITMFTFSSVFASLQATLLNGLKWAVSAPAPAPVHAARATARAAVRPQPVRACVRKPLRVVRVFEGAHAPAHAGRMVISGRMADVCAELDRLAALEAAMH